jgi:magnesium-transporting ATPase (P-type)
MALAYSTVMLELSGKIRILEQVIDMECPVETKIQLEDGLRRNIKRFLFASVILLFLVFIPVTIWLGIVVYKPDNTVEQRLNVYKETSVFVWTFFTIISLLLACTGMYAIRSLRRLFGSSFNSEICWLTTVLVVFVSAFVIRTVFNWYCFIVFSVENEQPFAYDKFIIGFCMLPILWDYIPIACVLITHLSNFKKETLNENKSGQLEVSMLTADIDN